MTPMQSQACIDILTEELQQQKLISGRLSLENKCLESELSDTKIRLKKLQNIVLGVLMLISFFVTVAAKWYYDSNMVTVMGLFAFCCFWILMWYVNATEYKMEVGI